MLVGSYLTTASMGLVKVVKKQTSAKRQSKAKLKSTSTSLKQNARLLFIHDKTLSKKVLVSICLKPTFPKVKCQGSGILYSLLPPNESFPDNDTNELVATTFWQRRLHKSAVQESLSVARFIECRNVHKTARTGKGAAIVVRCDDGKMRLGIKYALTEGGKVLCFVWTGEWDVPSCGQR